MNISQKRALLKIQLEENLADLKKSLIALLFSYEKCQVIGKKTSYDMEEQESFEALTSRFARTADILTQKVFKTLFILLQENVKTIIDSAHLAEKLEIVESSDDIIHIRELRNQIAHEYVSSNLIELFNDILQYIQAIERVIENVIKYSEKEIKR